MAIRLLVFVHRHPSLTPTAFRDCYETHVALLQRLTTTTFPLSHRRSYLARNLVDAGSDTLPLHQPVDITYDAIAELTFADHAALAAFQARITAPDVAAQIAADEETFLDRAKLRVVWLGDVVESMGVAAQYRVE
ncbi:EthD domain-containing protein [Aspergillus saccharolyticus JOP 1030-1]|uniref:EthD domain-containing protein n=1 Tax=Aspergillus saccharolyticus JOP 1030-1 TaxID=1450539 RepID=A0A318ZG02_9EURO|nr:hypothetical protein BP01DRAFT_385433 [Aspergillus saccharolyticus JOP 1030-1]PYH42550.1 hypothetical protein BP01DRAFT_385433 [Aspergillus saccharolyticus JOP 1030-1]